MPLILPMGFDDECFGRLGGSVVYTCKPEPGLRIAVWPGYDKGRARLNLYLDSTTGESLTHQRDRAMLGHDPIECDNDPLILQANILHLVELYKATLPTEVTNEEA